MRTSLSLLFTAMAEESIYTYVYIIHTEQRTAVVIDMNRDTADRQNDRQNDRQTAIKHILHQVLPSSSFFLYCKYVNIIDRY